MPQKTFYLRKEDESLWKAIEDKAQFIHDALRSTDIKNYVSAVKQRKEIEKIIEPYTNLMKTPATREAQMDRINAQTEDWRKKAGSCKIHGTPLDSRGRCLQKGCKYA